MYQFILFDLDGTLTDPKEGICKAVQYALKHYGITEDNLDVLEPFIGPPLSDSFEEFYGFSKEQAIEAVDVYREYFSVKGIYENKLFEGIPELLQNLKAQGVKLGIASSKPQLFVEKILQYFDIIQFFDVIVGATMDGSLGKKEDIVEVAINAFGIGDREDKKSIAMVGDRKFDVYGAKCFGLTPVAVSYGYGSIEELQQAGAEIIAKSVGELEEILKDEKEGEN